MLLAEKFESNFLFTCIMLDALIFFWPDSTSIFGFDIEFSSFDNCVSECWPHELDLDLAIMSTAFVQEISLLFGAFSRFVISCNEAFDPRQCLVPLAGLKGWPLCLFSVLLSIS